SFALGSLTGTIRNVGAACSGRVFARAPEADGGGSAPTEETRSAAVSTAPSRKARDLTGNGPRTGRRLMCRPLRAEDGVQVAWEGEPWASRADEAGRAGRAPRGHSARRAT